MNIPNPIVVDAEVVVNDVVVDAEVVTQYDLPIDLETLEADHNGNYSAPAGKAWDSAHVAVPGPTGTVQINANGTVNVEQYASAEVNVPNSYSAQDEGKVVQSGALEAQTSRTVTENATYDTTANNSVTVAVPGTQINPLSVLANGSYTAPDGTAYSPVNVDVEVGATKAVPSWKRPSNWPNLDLVDETQTDTVYVTIFCDGTWDTFLFQAWDGSTADTKVIQLNADRTETVLGTIPTVHLGGGRQKNDISGLSNGIHLLKLTTNIHKSGLRAYPEIFIAKTLEVLLLNPTTVDGTSSSNQNDWANGVSAYTERIKVVGVKGGLKTLGGGFPAMEIGNLAEIILKDCTGKVDLTYMPRYCSAMLKLAFVDCEITTTKLPALYQLGLVDTVDLTGIDFSSATGSISNSWGFNLVNYSGLSGVSVSHSYATFYKLSHQSLLNIIAGLATVNTATTLTLGSINTAKLTTAEIAVATQKGWTVA